MAGRRKRKKELRIAERVAAGDPMNAVKKRAEVAQAKLEAEEADAQAEAALAGIDGSETETGDIDVRDIADADEKKILPGDENADSDESQAAAEGEKILPVDEAEEKSEEGEADADEGKEDKAGDQG